MKSLHKKLLTFSIILFTFLACNKSDVIPQSNYTIPEFVELMDSSAKQSYANVTLKEASGFPGSYEAKGQVDFVVDAQTGKLKDNNWNDGAVHTLIGNITIKGYKFSSDTNNPLVFEMVWSKGYVYKHGKGTVTTPKDTTIYLESK